MFGFCPSSSDSDLQAGVRNTNPRECKILVLTEALNFSAHHLPGLFDQAVSKETSLPSIHKRFKNSINFENFGISKTS